MCQLACYSITCALCSRASCCVCLLRDPPQPVLLASVTGYLVNYTSHCDNQLNTTEVGNVSTTTIGGLYSYSNYTLRMAVVCKSTTSTTLSPPHIFMTPSRRKPHYCSCLPVPTHNHCTPPPPRPLRCDGSPRECVGGDPQHNHTGGKVAGTGPLRLEWGA